MLLLDITEGEYDLSMMPRQAALGKMMVTVHDKKDVHDTASLKTTESFNIFSEAASTAANLRSLSTEPEDQRLLPRGLGEKEGDGFRRRTAKLGTKHSQIIEFGIR